MEIGTDAPPWGLGGWLSIYGRITHYFACPITVEDVDKFKVPIGTADGQQLWGWLAVLVAFDAWSHHWNQRRIVFKLRGDNIGALTICLKMRPANPAVAAST